MRRLIAEPARYVDRLGRAVATGWDAFFFRPADPTPVGLIRLCLGLLLLWDFGVLGLDLHAFLGADGWADPEAVRFIRDRVGPTGPSWSFWFLVPDPWLTPAYAVCMAVLLLFTVGLWSRTTSALTWAIVVSTAGRSPVIVFGFDQAASMLAFYLAVTGSSGRAVSIDRFVHRWRTHRAEFAARCRGRRPFDGAIGDGTPEPSVGANLCLRLIQLHLCVIYGVAGLAKLQQPIWWEGGAVLSLLGYAEFRPVDLTALARWPMVLMAFSHAALFLEVAYPVLIWPVVLRPIVLASVAALHLGIAASMGLYEFALAMIVANLAFVSGPWLRSLVTGRSPVPVRVVYDGACPFCRSAVAIGGAADPSRTIEWVDLTAVAVAEVHPGLTEAACVATVHVVGPGDRVRTGFDAVVAVARRAPLLWPLAVVGPLPGVSTVGDLLYNRIASDRPRDEDRIEATAPGDPAGARDGGRRRPDRKARR